MSVDVNALQLKKPGTQRRLQELLSAMGEAPRAIMALDSSGDDDMKIGILTDSKIISAGSTRLQAWELKDIAKVERDLAGTGFLSRASGRLSIVYVVPNPGNHVEAFKSGSRQAALEFAEEAKKAVTTAVLNGAT